MRRMYDLSFWSLQLSRDLNSAAHPIEDIHKRPPDLVTAMRLATNFSEDKDWGDLSSTLEMISRNYVYISRKGCPSTLSLVRRNLQALDALRASRETEI